MGGADFLLLRHPFLSSTYRPFFHLLSTQGCPLHPVVSGVGLAKDLVAKPAAAAEPSPCTNQRTQRSLHGDVVVYVQVRRILLVRKFCRWHCTLSNIRQTPPSYLHSSEGNMPSNVSLPFDSIYSRLCPSGSSAAMVATADAAGVAGVALTQ